jgi:hypothetical protein
MRISVIGISVSVLAGVLVLTGCGGGAKTDQLQIVSDWCRSDVKKDLRDPDSARFGEEEYIAETKVSLSTPTESGVKPARAYDLVGTVSSRNGFGGMSNRESYKCTVGFDSNGKIIEELGQSRSHISGSSLDADLNFLKNYGATGPIVTRTVTP